TKSNSAGLSFTQSPLKKVPELYLNRAEADYALRRLRLWFPSHWQSHLRARPHHRPWEDSQTQEEALEEISGGIWAHTSVRRRRDPVEMPAARDRNWGVRPVAGDGGSKTRGRTPQDSVAHRPDQQSHPAHREGSCGKRDPPCDLLGASSDSASGADTPGPTNCPSRGHGVLVNGTCYGREHIIGIRPDQPDRADYEDKDQCEHHGIFCDVLPLILHPESVKKRGHTHLLRRLERQQSGIRWVASEESNQVGAQT